VSAGRSFAGRSVSLQQRDAGGRWLSVAWYRLGEGSQTSFGSRDYAA
jgi:hypothetical protein